MADVSSLENGNFNKKSFWQRPEGVAGAIFGLAAIGGIAYLLITYMGTILAFAGQTLGLIVVVLVIAALLYMIFDPRMRNLVWYMYKSVMRWVTGLFVTIDPIGILKNYVDDLKDNLRKMSKQIGALRGQMRQMQGVIQKNSEDIEMNMKIARKAKEQNNEKAMLLSTRKAARLKDSNEKYAVLYKKMEVLHRVLKKMYENSEILLEDTKDQVKLKEQERKAIRASHSAMKSAMNIISGSSDKREMFDMALEHIAEDVSQKVGEMERFMDISAGFMDSIDLQKGIFEEDGLKMLEKWEKESTSLLLGDEKTKLLLNEPDFNNTLDLNSSFELPEADKKKNDSNQYDNLFD